MKKAIIGKKVGMTQIFDETGKVVPVTVIEAGPCKVVQKKSAEKEGYASIQLGFEEIPERKLNKPEKGHLDKAGVGALRVLHEFRLENANEMNVGDVVKADAFKEGDKVAVRTTDCDKIKECIEKNSARPVPAWLDKDAEKMTVNVTKLPERADIDFDIEEHLIVELYSK